MAARNEDWYAAQATRAYPLDDAATARDDAGLELPSQLLVDCRVRFPVTLGRFAYVGGMTVGPNIVTAILMAASDAARPPVGTAPGGTAIQPLGAVSLPRPVTPNRHYPIQPMVDGVGGWLVFGRGINDNEPYSGRFSTPIQSLLLPRVASAYHLLPIPSLGKLNVDPPLTDVIQLLGATDLEVVQDTREIEGGIVDAIIIRLVDSLDRNVFSLYTGPCGGRPESQTCNTPALQAINSVEPDCSGNLIIDFQGVNVIEFDGGGGLALDLALGMADVCLNQDYLPDSDGNLPGDYESQCPPPGPAPQPCTTLLSYWKLDEPGTGAIALDSGTLGANATDNLHNTTASTAAPIAAPVHFPDPHGRFFPASKPPGVPSGQTYLSTGIQPAHGFTNNFTVAAWVRCVGRVINQPFVGHAAFVANGIALGWNLVSQQTGLLAFTSGVGGNTQDVPLISEFTLPLNVWAHVAVVVTVDTIYLYFNGTKSANTSKVLPGASPGVATCLGKDFTGIDNYEFNGDLDDVRIYNVALTDSEIQILASGDDPPCGPPPVVQPPPAVGCVPIPYYESFDGALPTPWTVVNGNFDLEADDSPAEPFGLEGPQSGLSPGQIPGVSGLPPLHRARGSTAIPIVPVNQSYASIDQSQRNVSIWNCDFYDTSALPPNTLDMTCTTQIKHVAGPQINGGIIFNYIQSDPQMGGRPTYVLANVNISTGYLSLDVYNGQSITMSIGWAFGNNGQGGVGDFPVVGDWYQLLVRVRVNPRPNQGNTWLVGLHLSGVTNPAFRGIDVDQPWGWGPTKPLGRFGLGSNNAHTLFSWFQLEETPAGGPP